MKFILPPIIGAIIFFITIFIFEATNIEETILAWLVLIFITLIGVVFSYMKLNSNSSIKETIAGGISCLKNTSEEISSLVNDSDAEYYAVAEQEIKDDVINNGLWSQALVKAKGDENKRKIEYMKLRVKQLKKG